MKPSTCGHVGFQPHLFLCTRTCVSTRIANRTDESGLSTDNGLRPITISWTGRRMTIVNRILPKSNRQTISINGADETFRTLLVSRLQSVGSGPGTILEIRRFDLVVSLLSNPYCMSHRLPPPKYHQYHTHVFYSHACPHHTKE